MALPWAMEPALGGRWWEQGVNLGGPGGAEPPLPRSGSGHDPKGTEGNPSQPAFHFWRSHWQTYQEILRYHQCTPYSGFKSDINLFPCKWGAALQLLAAFALAPSSWCFMGKPSVIPQHLKAAQFPCMSCMEMALHTAALPRAKGFCSQGLVGSLVPFPAHWATGKIGFIGLKQLGALEPKFGVLMYVQVIIPG